MTAKEILAELKPLGSDGYKKVMFNHGVKEPCFGVKISELQKIQKRIKKDYQVALDLYDIGNYDAVYLAGLIADDAQMTKKDLQRWIANAAHKPACLRVVVLAPECHARRNSRLIFVSSSSLSPRLWSGGCTNSNLRCLRLAALAGTC